MVKQAILIAGRELRGRSRLFLFAAAFAVIPFAATLLPGARGHRADVIGIAGALLGAGLSFTVAIALGATTVGRELTERRLSFWFARPISGVALWIGKAAGALLASIACLLIVAGPAFLAVGRNWNAGDTRRSEILLIAPLTMIILFLVSHALSTVIRSRSTLLALDAVLLAGVATALYVVARRVAAAGDPRQAFELVNGAATLLVAGLALAPAWQLAQGRTDPRRNHIAFSRAFWPMAIVVVLATGAFAAWLITPDLDDLDRITMIQQPPVGNWAVASGYDEQRRGFEATFLVDGASGRTVRMPTPLWWGMTVSRDGRTVAWLQPDAFLRTTERTLYTRRLDDPGAEVVETTIRTNGKQVVLSDDGHRAAVADEKTISVHDLGSGALLASVSVPEGNAVANLFFTSPDVVRIVQPGRGDLDALRIFEWNLAARSLVKTGQSAEGLHGPASASADGTRLYNGAGVILDARSGATIGRLPEWNASSTLVRMLHDGSVVRTGTADGKAHVQMFAPDGTMRHEIVLAGMQHAFTSAATSDGKVIVAASNGARRNTYAIDLASGRIARVLEGTRAHWPGWHTDPRSFAYPAGAELLATDGKGRLVKWNVDRRDGARAL